MKVSVLTTLICIDEAKTKKSQLFPTIVPNFSSKTKVITNEHCAIFILLRIGHLQTTGIFPANGYLHSGRWEGLLRDSVVKLLWVLFLFLFFKNLPKQSRNSHTLNSYSGAVICIGKAVESGSPFLWNQSL